MFYSSLRDAHKQFHAVHVLRFAGDSVPRVPAVVTADAAALGGPDLKLVGATQVLTRQIWVGASGAIISTTMLEHCVRMLFAGAFELAVADEKNLLPASAGQQYAL